MGDGDSNTSISAHVYCFHVPYRVNQIKNVKKVVSFELEEGCLIDRAVKSVCKKVWRKHSPTCFSHHTSSSQQIRRMQIKPSGTLRWRWNSKDSMQKHPGTVQLAQTWLPGAYRTKHAKFIPNRFGHCNYPKAKLCEG